MALYFLINVAVSLSILALLKFGNGTNKVNYYISCLGLLAWFIPYTWIASLLPNEVLVEPIIISQSFDTTTAPIPAVKASGFSLEQFVIYLAIAALLIGIALFFKQIVKAKAFNHSILHHSSFRFRQDLSEQYQVQVYSSDNAPSGMLLGFLSPKVVIASSLPAQQLKLIISHEKTHLMRHDNYRLLVLEGIASLFWWNPLVRALIDKNKFLIEAICDETTSAQYGLNKYVEDFAALILHNHKANNPLFYSTATSNKHNNMSRLKLLKENRKMTLKGKLVYTLTLSSILSAMVWNTFAVASASNTSMLNKDVPKVSVSNKKQLIAALEKMAGNQASFYSDTSVLVVNGEQQNKTFINNLSLNDIGSINVKTGTITEFQITTNEPNNKATQGVLVNFDLQIKDRSDKDMEREVLANASMWVDFSQKASFKVNDDFKFNFKVSDLGGEQAFFDMEIVEVSGASEEVVSSPKMQMIFSQEGMIEIDNFETSPHAYAIKLKAERVVKPE